jgi:hypothetical protein
VQRFVEAIATADEPQIVLTVNHASAPAVRTTSRAPEPDDIQHAGQQAT